MMDIHMGSQTAVSPGLHGEARAEDRVGAWSSGNPTLGRARGEQGQALIEFALILPLLLTLVLGGVTFGIALNNYLTLTNATAMGAQALSISRGQTTDPCTTASGAVYGGAPNLTPANLKFTIVLNGKTVAGPNQAAPSCSGDQTDLVESQPAQVTVTYPCNLNFFGYKPAPGCTLTAKVTEAIQ